MNFGDVEISNGTATKCNDPNCKSCYPPKCEVVEEFNDNSHMITEFNRTTMQPKTNKLYYHGELIHEWDARMWMTSFKIKK